MSEYHGYIISDSLNALFDLFGMFYDESVRTDLGQKTFLSPSDLLHFPSARDKNDAG